MAYMEMFGNCSHSSHNTSEFLRHSVHTYNVTHSSAEHITHNHNITHSQTMRYVFTEHAMHIAIPTVFATNANNSCEYFLIPLELKY